MAGSEKYDLEERTTCFAENMIDFAATIPRNVVTNPLISQVVRSSTSVGANYLEADDAVSRKDFIHKLGICKREARETTYWLKMIVRAHANSRIGARPLYTEANELYRIFAAIIRSTRNNDLNRG